MDDFMRQLEGKNTRKIRDMCEVTLQNESTKLRENINKNHYRAAGGHKIFKRDLNKLKDKFMNDLRDFEEHEVSVVTKNVRYLRCLSMLQINDILLLFTL